MGHLTFLFCKNNSFFSSENLLHLESSLTYILYLPEIFGQKGLSKQCRHMVHTVGHDFSNLDTLSGSLMGLFKFKGKYGKEIRCPNI